RKGIAKALDGLGRVALKQRDYTAARTAHEESLAIRQEIGEKYGAALSLQALAELAAVQQETERAVRLWGAAERLREEIGARLSLGDQEEHDAAITRARQELGREAFAAAWEEGQQETLLSDRGL